jgi:hypothetical protein
MVAEAEARAGTKIKNAEARKKNVGAKFFLLNIFIL